MSSQYWFPCYSNGCKSKCQKMVFGISILLGLLGLLTLIFGILQTGVIPPSKNAAFEKDNGFSIPSRSGYAIAIILFGIYALVMSILGCATSSYQKAVFAVPFGVLTFVLGVSLLVLGLVAFGFTDGFVVVRDAVCSNPTFNIWKMYNEQVDKVMCSSLCKCDPRAKPKLEYLGDAMLKSNGRTMNKLAKQSEINDFKQNKWAAKIVPL